MSIATATFEWDIETIDENDEIISHNHAAHLKLFFEQNLDEAIHQKNHKRLALVRDDDDGRAWAYYKESQILTGWELRDAFDKIVGVVPKKFQDELGRMRSLLNKFYDVKHPVAIAVEPQRKEALARAEKDAKGMIEKVAEKLAACNWDREIAAPYPPNNIDRMSFTMKYGYYQMVRRLTKQKADANGFTHSRRPHDPDPCVMDSNGKAKFIKDAIENADASYTAFICKLVKKIGACDAAVLTGSHVWGYSILKVDKGEKVENWKTQQIVNISKLGTVFNQWPSRIVKGGAQ